MGQKVRRIVRLPVGVVEDGREEPGYDYPDHERYAKDKLVLTPVRPAHAWQEVVAALLSFFFARFETKHSCELCL